MNDVLKPLRKTVVLPRKITSFEVEHLRKMNRLATVFFACHIPAFILIAWFNETRPSVALVLTSLVVAGPVLAAKLLDNPRHHSVVHGITAMLMGGLLVHFGQGPVQIEMHFYFFALIAMLSLFGNPMVIIAAAVTVAVHHLAMWYLLPSSVFNYDAPLWVVLVHALFVALESTGTVFLTRSFFDNVIGLERIVNRRTAELEDKNTEMRLVLDHVEEALFVLDLDGNLCGERSAPAERLFGQPKPTQPFAEWLARLDSRTSMMFEVGIEQLAMGMLPLDVAIAQLPESIDDGRHYYSLEYVPVESEGSSKLMVVMSDITQNVERGRLQAQQREALHIFNSYHADRRGFVEFVEEARALTKVVCRPFDGDLRGLQRALHTLKGNALVFGVDTVAAACHELEDFVDRERRAPSLEQLSRLRHEWDRLEERLGPIFKARVKGIELDRPTYARLLSLARNPEATDELVRTLEDASLESTARRLRRVREHAKQIAHRLGKGDIKVHLDDGGLALEPASWSGFWSSFVHAVRNAIDHGLEAPEARLKAGKVPFGVLVLSTRVEDDTFVVALEDDGRGIDWDRVRTRAQSLGLSAETPAELEDALFSDGFSTAADVTDISGRGVGMSALAAACHERGGTIEITTKPDVGTRFAFRFPVASMRGSSGDLAQAA